MQFTTDASDLTPRELCLIAERLELRLDLERMARDLQASEYARRLDELNHAHRDAKLRDDEFISRTEYGLHHQNLERQMAEFGKVVAVLNIRVSSMMAWGGGLGFALTILMFVLNRIWK